MPQECVITAPLLIENVQMRPLYQSRLDCENCGGGVCNTFKPGIIYPMMGGAGTTHCQSIVENPQIPAFHEITAKYINLSNMLDNTDNSQPTEGVNATPIPDCANQSYPKPTRRTSTSKVLHSDFQGQPPKLALPKHLVPPKLRKPNSRRWKTVSRGRGA